MKIPYERIVAWLAGPISIIAGYLATQLVQHVGLFGDLGIGHDQVAKAIVAATTFVVGAGATYLAHAKWMSNLVAWWNHVESLPPAPAPVVPALSVEDVQNVVSGELAKVDFAKLANAEVAAVLNRGLAEEPPAAA